MRRLASLPVARSAPVARVPLSGDHTPSRRIVAITRAGAEEQQSAPFVLSELRRAVDSLAELR